jgi:hypothetical protein
VWRGRRAKNKTLSPTTTQQLSLSREFSRSVLALTHFRKAEISLTHCHWVLFISHLIIVLDSPCCWWWWWSKKQTMIYSFYIVLLSSSSRNLDAYSDAINFNLRQVTSVIGEIKSHAERLNHQRQLQEGFRESRKKQTPGYAIIVSSPAARWWIYELKLKWEENGTEKEENIEIGDYF